MNRRAQRGFTLLEVMIALAILAGGLALSIAATAANVQLAHKAQMLGVATNLARGKMYDVEEELIQDGFQELDKTEDGDFSDEGWPDIEWEVEIKKIELPGLAALQAAGGEAADGEEGGDSRGTETADSASAFAGAGLIGSQFETIANVLERSIRRVNLKVTWNVGQKTEEMTVVCYFTNRQGVDEALAGAPAAGGGEDDGSGDGGGATGGGNSGEPGPGSKGPRGGGIRTR